MAVKTSWHRYGNKTIGALVDLQPNYPCSKTGNILSLQHHRLTDTARRVCRAGSMKRSSVRPSVCPIDRQQQRHAAGLLLSAVRAGDLDQQQARRSATNAGSVTLTAEA